MKAKDHTDSMLCAWMRMGILRADLAVRRSNGSMVWQRAKDLRLLPLPWARAENASAADIYLRPARGESWPLVFLDDVPVPTALRVARKYKALAVQTSVEGGCHVWLASAIALTEAERSVVQQWLVSHLGADPGSTSGEHLGRLAGFRNWKRGGNWVNVLHPPAALPSWNPEPALVGERSTSPIAPDAPRDPRRGMSPRRRGLDASMSGREWGWACRLLETGAQPKSVYRLLVDRARARRGDDAERYASRTVARATFHVRCRAAPTREGAPPLT